tara:strand:+ start:97 stop:393 length:297 start_codon:yes stop_codon:yes gene_type:complete
MLKRISIILVIISIFFLVIYFTSINQNSIRIDFGFVIFEPSVVLGVSLIFILGWIFGLLCSMVYIIKLTNEQRNLKSNLKDAQSELSGLRQLPTKDAN